jgi:hypothetical protein
MPNGMDLDEITQYRKDSTFVATGGQAVPGSGKVTYAFRNIFVQQPQTMCDASAVKESSDVVVQVSQPANGTTLGTSFTVSYAVQSPKNIRKVLVMLDNQTVGTFLYPAGNTKSITDTKQVNLMAT